MQIPNTQNLYSSDYWIIGAQYTTDNFSIFSYMIKLAIWIPVLYKLFHSVIDQIISR